MQKLRSDRIGESIYNKYGTKFTIVKYTSYSKIIVETEDGILYTTNYGSFKKKQIRHKNEKSILNVGYLGDSRTYEEGKIKNSYKTWFQMMRRCYDFKFQKTNAPTYINCSVCEEWHCYANFEKWYDENYWECGEEKMQLDKDILIYNNKIYSPNSCIFIPHRINPIFSNINKTGVTFHKGRYIARTMGHNVGSFDTKEEAIENYKRAKTLYIKQVADEYKEKYDCFPQKLYNSMYNYNII